MKARLFGAQGLGAMYPGHVLVAGLAVAGLAASCGGSQKTAETPADQGTAGEESSAETKLEWKDMNREQRMEFMGLTVLPEMKKLFQEYDASYGEFKCQTCHGDDMKEVDYKMPNGLFALEKPDPIPASKEYDAKVTEFMMDKVKPKMAELLGEPEFGCFGCHDAEEAGAE